VGFIRLHDTLYTFSKKTLYIPVIICIKENFRALSDKRRKTLESEFHQYFLASSTDISLCELYAKVSAQLRALPAFFTVVDEASFFILSQNLFPYPLDKIFRKN
jgi:hypothetical protein